MQALYPLLIGMKEREASRLPDFQMWGCHQQLDGRNLGSKCSHFLFAGPCIARDCREGVSKEKEAHPSGWTLGIVWGGGGHSWPSGWLWQMQAPGLLFLNLCCSSITRQWAQEGFSYRQQVKSSVGQKRVLRDVFSFMLCFYMDLRMAESTSAFWGGLAVFFFSFLPFLMAALSAICCTKLACHFRSGLLVLLAWLSRRVSWWFVKSQSHRMGKVARDHTESSDPASLHHTDLHQGVCPYLL